MQSLWYRQAVSIHSGIPRGWKCCCLSLSTHVTPSLSGDASCGRVESEGPGLGSPGERRPEEASSAAPEEPTDALHVSVYLRNELVCVQAKLANLGVHGHMF